jgi:pyruvate,water dikinase
LLFNDKLKAEDEKKFWFCDSQHWPYPFKPFDVITVEFAVKCLSQYNTRHLLVPPANGLDSRILNGYLYLSPVPVAPEKIPERVPLFLERAGYYFQNWNTLLDNWNKKIRGVIAEMEALTFEGLPETVALDWIKSGRGLDNTQELLANYDKAIQLCYTAWQYHFEFLNLGYAAYLDFFIFCKERFPNIPELAVARMVQGIDVDLFRPDDELKRLARLAVELGVDGALEKGLVDEALAAVSGRPNGEKWLAEWKAAQQPWFNFTTGNGFYSRDKYWIEHLDIPLGFLRDYIKRVRRGENIERPTAALAAERERIIKEYSELLSDEARQVFEGKLGLARVVFPYVENHNFYIEHWFMGTFWRKMRELSRVLKEAGFWSDPDDMFYLSRNELRDVLFDYAMAWAAGVDPVGPKVLGEKIAARRKIIAALYSQQAQPALNEPPEVITEPFTIMLWGITTDTVKTWLKGKDATGANQLTGMAASPGTVEGNARIVRSDDDLEKIEDGEILVATVTAPAWAPVFSKIKGAVTDIGGMMSHAAIVCREYGLPAVTATGTATSSIKNGQRLRVDGSKGEVTILS